MHLANLVDIFEQLNKLNIQMQGRNINIIKFNLSVEKVPDHCQDEFLELKTNSRVRDMFNEKSIIKFWPQMFDSNPKVTEIAIRAMLQCVDITLRVRLFNSVAN